MIWLLALAAAWLLFGLAGLGLGAWLASLQAGIVRRSHELERCFTEVVPILERRHEAIVELLDIARSTGCDDDAVARATELVLGFSAAQGAEAKVQVENGIGDAIDDLTARLEALAEPSERRRQLEQDLASQALEARDAGQRYNELVTEYHAFLSRPHRRPLAAALVAPTRTYLALADTPDGALPSPPRSDRERARQTSAAASNS